MNAAQANYRPLSAVQRSLLIALGTVTLGIGIAGMFLPGLPTTVFLLITLGCYTRSSERLYRWVLTRPWLQKPLQTAFAYKERRTLPVRVKLLAQGVAWSSVLLLALTGARPIFLLFAIAFAGACTLFMAWVKTEGDDAPARAWRGTPGDVALQLGYGALSGAFAGAIGGLAGVVILQLVSNLAGALQPVDLGRVLAIVAGGVALGALGGLAYAALRRILPPGKWARGLVFGALVALTAGVGAYLSPAARPLLAEFGPGWREATLALFVVAFLAYGVITCLTFRRLEQAPA